MYMPVGRVKRIGILRGNGRDLSRRNGYKRKITLVKRASKSGKTVHLSY